MSVRQRNGMVARQRLAGHFCRRDLFPVIGQELIAEVLRDAARERAARAATPRR